MRLTGIIIIIALSGYTGWFFLWPETATLEICNAAPYTVNYSVNYPNSTTKDKSTPLEELKPGQCAYIVKDFYRIKSQFYVHAQSISDEANVTWAYSPGISSGDQVIFPSSNENIARQRSIPLSAEHKEPFALARNIRQDKKKSQWEFLLYDSSFNLVSFDSYKCGHECKQIALLKAGALSNAFHRQMSYKNNFTNKEVPYFIAGEMTDLNGPFNVGLQVDKAITQSIKGFPLSIRDGDIIVSLNNTVVFSPEDFYILLHKHATSRYAGIAKPITIEAIRDNKKLLMQSTYFFNRQYWGYSSQQETATIVNGVLDAVTLGLAAEARCGLGTALHGIANGLSWLTSKLSSKPQDMKKNKTLDYSGCVWRHTQAIAMQRQFGGDLFDNAAWLSLVTPSAPRLLLSKAMGKKALSVIGSRQAGKFLTTVSGEIAETLIWTVNDASPLASAQQITGEVRKIAPYAAAIGVVAGVLNRR